MRKTLLYYIIIWTVLIGCVVLLAKLAPILYSPDYMLVDDFGRYWASGKLFIAQENPYDLEKLTETQVLAGASQSVDASIASQTLNPPWSLFIFAPMGLLDYSTARIVWLFISIGLIVITVKQFWRILSRSENKLWVALLVAFSFTPTYSVLSKGQATPWVILGLAGVMLYWEGNLSVWFTGVCLVLISIKPQLFYLLWPALGIWVITQRRWKILLAGLVIGLAAILATLLVNGQIYSQYFNAIQDYPYDQWATPTIGSYLRLFWLGVDKFWVQYLPALFGLTWLAVYYWKHRKNWIWRDQVPLLSIISLLTSPYAWTYDAVIILPAILVATSKLVKQYTLISISFWLIYLVINLSNLILHAQLSDFWFIWLVPSYTLWFFITTKCYPQSKEKLQVYQ